jgi:hypothetical protein
VKSPPDQVSQGAHVMLEHAALTNGRVCLASAMEHGFVGLLDIPAEVFHPDLRPVAMIVREARENGAKEFADVLLYLTQTMEPGEKQDLLRAKIANVSEEVHHAPDKLEGSVAVVRRYNHARCRQHLLWKMNAASERGEPIGDFLKQLAELEAGGNQQEQSKSFEYFHADDLDGPSEALDFVEGLLNEAGASLIYGPSNCGKSFWIVDLGAAVAAGRPFRDELQVDQGAVIYVALEGAQGARNRMAALRKQGLLKSGDPFYLVFDQVSLLEPGHAARLAATVAAVAKKSGQPVKMVILDTMARAMAGGDENSGSDMTLVVKAIDAVRAATGAHVAIVHHSGKDQAKGARGHSSLRAAVDTEIEITRRESGAISTARVTKQRDLQASEPMPFSLKVVVLGINRRGKPITSCVVHHEDSIFSSNSVGKSGRPPKTNVAQLLSMLPQPSTTAWQKVARSDHGVTQTPFYRVLSEIKRKQAASYSKQGGWIFAEPNFGSEFA